MKKQLLVGSALMLALSTYSQNKQAIQPSSIVNMAEKLASKFEAANTPNEKPATANKNSNPNTEVEPSFESSASSASSPIISATFTRFSGSMNVFGMLVSSQKALQYNRQARAFSFIQRKSPTYVVSPAGDSNSGAIVAYIGKNDGAQWDSTLIFADANNLARYPQGGIYNPGNQNDIEKCYVVGSGPVTGGSGWIGSWYASKSLTATAVKNAAGPDEQFFSNTGPNFGSTTSPNLKKHDFPRYGFAVTEDGAVRSAASLMLDINATTNAGQAFRGAHIAKGSFVTGAFVWTSDSIIPPTVTRTDGSKQVYGNPYMAWNDAGTHGYVVFIGARTGATGANVGWQPIVYKTTNSGNTWALVNGIDFNSSAFDFVTGSMAAVNSNSNLAIPFFNVGEGIDMVVDKNNKLHIVSTAVGTARQHQDSLEYTWQFPKGTENMSWPYVNTAWPYIFDFTGDGTAAWSLKVVDSVGTEGPSSTSGNPGFGSNPWANQSQSNPVSSDMRVQVSRSYDGEYIVYSWAESDTTLTTGATKWNEFPNIKQRAMRLCDGSISTDELTISSPGTGFNPRVRDKAYFHFMGSTCKAGSSTNTSATFTVPYTVTNNLTTDGGISVDNFFSSAVVTHSFASSACGSTITTGVNQVATETSSSFVYPNPTKNNVNVDVNLTSAKDITVDVYNAIGQVINSVKVNGQMGNNTINVNLNNANAGVYFVKIKAGSSETTKKLIIE